MENFFYDIEFCSDLGELMNYLELDDEESVNALPDDYELEVDLTTEEKMFVIDMDSVVNAIIDETDKWEDRFPEDADYVFGKIKSAVKQSVDIEKLNSLIPSLYYPNGKHAKITKADLLEYLK